MEGIKKREFYEINPGEKILYHTGFLPRDVLGRPDLAQTRDDAYYAFDRGRAMLFQKRITDPPMKGVYQYFIQGVELGSIERMARLSNGKYEQYKKPKKSMRD